jgi:hypothetical protein
MEVKMKTKKVILLAFSLASFVALSSCAKAELVAQPGIPTISPVTVIAGTPVPAGSTGPVTEFPAGNNPGTATEPAPGESRIITLNDRGSTIPLKVGDQFLLKLGEGFEWSINISDLSVISRVPNILVVKGAQGVFVAHQPGKVTLSAAGDPLCRQSKPACGMPSIAFEVTLVVQ